MMHVSGNHGSATTVFVLQTASVCRRTHLELDIYLTL
jgi:hypothetical protein